MGTIDERSDEATDTREEQRRSPLCGGKYVAVLRADYRQDGERGAESNACSNQGTTSDVILCAQCDDLVDFHFRNAELPSGSIDQGQESRGHSFEVTVETIAILQGDHKWRTQSQSFD